MNPGNFSAWRYDVIIAKFRHVALALAAWSLIAGLAWQPARAAFPERLIKIVVPFTPGGGTDVIARALAQEMARDLGGSVIIENKLGAGTIIGTQAVATSAPDGYTLLMGTFANAVNPSLYAKLPYDAHGDFAAVSLISRSFNLVVVNPASPIKSIADLIAAAKAEPDKLSYGTYGTGTSAHLAGELFKHMAKVNLTTVPYKGAAPAITDLLGGQVQVIFDNMPSVLQHIKAGKLRALAVTTAVPSPELPDVPTVAETVKDYEASAWFGMGVPKNTPKEIIATLNKAINEILAEPAMKARLAELGGVPIVATPEEFGKVIQAETDKWEKVVNEAGIPKVE